MNGPESLRKSALVGFFGVVVLVLTIVLFLTGDDDDGGF